MQNKFNIQKKVAKNYSKTNCYSKMQKIRGKNLLKKIPVWPWQIFAKVFYNSKALQHDGLVAQWIKRLPPEQKIVGSNPIEVTKYITAFNGGFHFSADIRQNTKNRFPPASENRFLFSQIKLSRQHEGPRTGNMQTAAVSYPVIPVRHIVAHGVESHRNLPKLRFIFHTGIISQVGRYGKLAVGNRSAAGIHTASHQRPMLVGIVLQT